MENKVKVLSSKDLLSFSTYISPLMSSFFFDEDSMTIDRPSSARASRSQVYPPKLRQMVLRLQQLLQEMSFTQNSFAKMMTILNQIVEKSLYLNFGSVCMMLRTGVWRITSKVPRGRLRPRRHCLTSP